MAHHRVNMLTPLRLSLCLSLMGYLVTLGCSATARQRLKHWFFEVPESGQVSESASAEEPSHPPVPVPALAYLEERPSLRPSPTSVHPPYVLRQCTECHNAQEQMAPRDDLLESCKSCHTRYFSEEVGHAPVQMGQCTECHDMHRSDQRFLQTMPTFDLCIECHDVPEDLSQPVHGVKGAKACTACHDPHFGSGALLKPEPAIEIPKGSETE